MLIPIILSIILVLFLLDVLLTGKTPLVTTPSKSRKKIINIIQLDKNSIFYDLGCGTSRLLVDLSKSYPLSKFIGIDNSPFSYVLSKLRIKLSKSKNISIKYGDFFDCDLSSATHIYLWIYVKDMDKLLMKFKSELKEGTLVYSLDFPFSNKEPEEVRDLGRENRFGHTLYIYKF
jgi:ubiquinone/menaquinone biosynthesis C-methylase UbiE